MKFVCDSCNTKYSIADDRVHGRVLKIRCKTCDHVITVREEMKAAPAASSSMTEALGRNLAESENEHTVVSMPPPSAPAETADEWYVSFDGEQEGPMPLQRALDRVRVERPKGKEAHCWRPGFFVWLAIEDVPEFAPAIERKRKPTPPPPLPVARAAKSPTGPQPVVKSPTGPQPVAKSPTGPQPVAKSPTGSQPVAKSPTGSQPVVKSPTGSQPVQKPALPISAPAAAGGVSALTSELPPVSEPFPPVMSEPLPPLDSKPMALPPPPEPLKDAPLNLPLPAIPAPLPMGDSIPSGPMAVQLTKPEPRIARRLLEEEDKKPEKRDDKKPEPLIPSGAPEVSAFAAALAAATGSEPKQPDTGPVPLPPPPGESDLAIGEPSGLLSTISHLGQPTPSLSREKPVIDTFGGVAVTPAGQNGTSSAAPVVVVAGPAQSAAAWVKWSVAGLLLLVVCLGVTVVVLATKKPLPTNPKPGDSAEANKHVDDKPIQFADPAPPTSIGPATPSDPKKSAPPPPKHTPTTSKGGVAGTSPKLNDEQKKLAALYGDSSEKGSPKETAVVDRGERASGGQVSQASILAVVTQNRRALNLCYDRVLKHDSTLKRARLVTHVKVGLSGAVKDVSVPDPEYANSEIGQCLTQTIRRWHFPAADAEYETEFPIILQAE
jgi:predicted Zn finger-like uncharacterized protein